MKKLMLLLTTLVVLMLPGCMAPAGEPALDPPLAVEPESPTDESITILGTGDILMHNNVIASGSDGSGGYDFNHLYEPIKLYIESADHASACLECALAGAESGYTGYPQFNSPDELATALKNAGFDLINTAGNHCMDRGLAGGLRTLQVLQDAGLDTIGTNASAEAKATPYIREINGFKLAYLAYSYSTNGIPIPASAPWYFNDLDKDQVLEDISAVREQADLVILLLHWGVEYSPYPTEEQTQWARDFFAAGADLILGSHPHVIQPAEIISVDGKDKLVIYSMGNSIGSQNGIERNSGVMVTAEFTRDGADGAIALSGYEFIPTYIHRYNASGKQLFRALPITTTIAAIENGGETILTADDIPLLESVYTATMDTLCAMGLELDQTTL
ncbi:MAG: CapA family protein [Syntrophomonadaceae bacterium]|nr:CapA family protein [Syntrophomonadaceae bacterium]